MAQDEPPPMSIQARIAALNLNQVAVNSPPSYDEAVRNGNGQTNGTNGAKRRPPPPLPTRVPKSIPSVSQQEDEDQSTNLKPMLPARRPSPALSNTSDYVKPMLPPRKSTADLRGASIDESKPPLPTRRPTTEINGDGVYGSPSLPPRRQSGQSSYDRRVSTTSVNSTLGRRPSIESIASTTSTASRRRVLAPEYDKESLPPLPRRTTRTVEEEEQDKPRLPKPSLPSRPTINESAKSRAPPLPGRPGLPSRSENTASELDGQEIPRLPSRPRPDTNGVVSPPPLPLSSKPNLSAAAQASKPSAAGSCLLCRDFRAPDEHAANFPRNSLPNVPDVIGWLARELTSPFDNRTDKARAIFTWLHHNVEYDCDGFFRGHSPIKGIYPTPDVTMKYGIAVCEGYAGLFVEIAEKAGLRALKISGHGKGYGHNPLSPNAPTPPKSMNHAWAGVLLDDNKWKLLDPCWGAGNVNGEVFNKAFEPSMFTMSNEQFGQRHFPDNPSHQFRYAEGMREISWEEYMRTDTDDKAKTFNQWENMGFSRESLQPALKEISTQGGGYVRFEFTKVCPHFSWTALGMQPFLPIMTVQGKGGKGYMQETWQALETDGYNFWVDIPRESLGLPGGQIMMCILEKFDGKDGRGVTKKQYDEAVKSNRLNGIKGDGLATWQLV